MIAPKVREYLERNGASFVETNHERVDTALQEARADHTPPRELAKTVVVDTAKGRVLVVLPASRRIDWRKLEHVLGDTQARLLSEAEVERMFPELETGAIPPLGHLFDLPMYLEAQLASEPEIAFNGGSHTSTIHMRLGDFMRLAEPNVRVFAAGHGWSDVGAELTAARVTTRSN